MPLFSKFDFITIGGATEDISMFIEDYHLIANRDSASGNPLLAFDYGTKVGVKQAVLTFGGGAANTAVCFATLGFKTAGLITYGNDERGRKIFDNLKRRKVDVSLTKKINEISGFSFLAVGANKDHVAFSYRAANSKLELTERDVSKLAQTKWLFITSLTGKWKENLDKIFSVANVRFAWNPGEVQIAAGYKSLKKYLKKLDVLSLNKDEAIKLLISHPDYAHKPYDFLVSSVNLLTAIKSWGPKIVVITNGSHGADAFDGREFFYQPVIESKVKEDTTGLGDAFGSSFVAGLEMFSYDIKRALYLAATNASAVIAQIGAQSGLLTRADIQPLFKKKL